MEHPQSAPLQARQMGIRNRLHGISDGSSIARGPQKLFLRHKILLIGGFQNFCSFYLTSF